MKSLSFYVVSFFNTISINEAIEMIKNLRYHKTTNLMGLCFGSLIIFDKGTFYEQTCEVAFMESFDKKKPLKLLPFETHKVGKDVSDIFAN